MLHIIFLSFFLLDLVWNKTPDILEEYNRLYKQKSLLEETVQQIFYNFEKNNNIKYLYEGLGEQIEINEFKQDMEESERIYLQQVIQKLEQIQNATRYMYQVEEVRIDYINKIEMKHLLETFKSELKTLGEQIKINEEQILIKKQKMTQRKSQEKEFIDIIQEMINGIAFFFFYPSQENAISIIEKIDLRDQQNYFQKYALLLDKGNSERLMQYIADYNIIRKSELTIHDLNLWNVFSLLSSIFHLVKLNAQTQFWRYDIELKKKLQLLELDCLLIKKNQAEYNLLIYTIEEQIQRKKHFLNIITQNKLSFEKSQKTRRENIDKVYELTLKAKSFYTRKRNELSTIVRNMVSSKNSKKKKNLGE